MLGSETELAATHQPMLWRTSVACWLGEQPHGWFELFICPSRSAPSAEWSFLFSLFLPTLIPHTASGDCFIKGNLRVQRPSSCTAAYCSWPHYVRSWRARPWPTLEGSIFPAKRGAFMAGRITGAYSGPNNPANPLGGWGETHVSKAQHV